MAIRLRRQEESQRDSYNAGSDSFHNLPPGYGLRNIFRELIEFVAHRFPSASSRGYHRLRQV